GRHVHAVGRQLDRYGEKNRGEEQKALGHNLDDGPDRHMVTKDLDHALSLIPSLLRTRSAWVRIRLLPNYTSIGFAAMTSHTFSFVSTSQRIRNTGATALRPTSMCPFAQIVRSKILRPAGGTFSWPSACVPLHRA